MQSFIVLWALSALCVSVMLLWVVTVQGTHDGAEIDSIQSEYSQVVVNVIITTSRPGPCVQKCYQCKYYNTSTINVCRRRRRRRPTCHQSMRVLFLLLLDRIYYKTIFHISIQSCRFDFVNHIYSILYIHPVHISQSETQLQSFVSTGGGDVCVGTGRVMLETCSGWISRLQTLIINSTLTYLIDLICRLVYLSDNLIETPAVVVRQSQSFYCNRQRGHSKDRGRILAYVRVYEMAPRRVFRWLVWLRCACTQ